MSDGTYVTTTDPGGKPRTMVLCSGCGELYGEGEWPLCPHGIPRGMLGEFKPYWDEHVAPEPSPEFRPRRAIDYEPHRGYHITSLADRRYLMKANKSDYRRVKRGMPGQEF